MKAAIAVASLVAALGAAAPALAAPPETPNGWMGACNMNSSWPGYSPSNGVAVQTGGGMERAIRSTTRTATTGCSAPSNAQATWPADSPEGHPSSECEVGSVMAAGRAMPIT